MPLESGYCESVNYRLRDEQLNGELFYGLAEAKIIIGIWRHPYNPERPRSSLGDRPPAPAFAVPLLPAASDQAERPIVKPIETGPPNRGGPTLLAVREFFGGH
ncbi:transposase [Ancylobacter pratisalsi]|uniref:Transposase n=1 Tax=Ancylobacter pratisalsi TaxID=1745854 RepID=A0A6P1YR24_9HYPH|nr:transposase [Ancylobacter pratisalsi]